MSPDQHQDLLQITLRAAVPLWIERVKHLSREDWQQRLHACAETIEQAGESILYAVPGRPAGVGFNAVAEAIACLAYCPGGIDLFGAHWEAVAEQQEISA